MGPRSGEFIKSQLCSRANEFKQLHEVAFTGIGVPVRLQLHACDVREVAQVFGDVARSLDRLVGGTRADAVEKPAAPGGKRRQPLPQRRFLCRQQRRELEFRRAQGLESL